MDLITSGQFEELRAQVFYRRLSENSETAFVDVLSENEEQALAKAVCNGDADAADFAKEYYQKYPPFNSALAIMFEYMNNALASDVVFIAIKRWSLVPEMAENLCRVAVGCDGAEDMFKHIKAFAENPRATVANSGVERWLMKVDGKWNEKEKLAEIYLAQFEGKNKVFSSK